MKFENAELDEEMIDRLLSNGIWLRKNRPKTTKEQALVLLGEAMLNKFFREFMNLWKNELFPSCLLKDFEASEEEVHEWIHGGNPQPDCILCSNNCKGVDKKMEQNTKEKLDSYLELLAEIRQQTQDERVAAVLLTEIAKDLRMEKIRQERNNNNGEPATDKQRKFMKKLGINFPKSISKQEASALIDEELGKNGNGE